MKEAYKNIVHMKRAQWDSSTGFTVQFLLPEPEGEDKSNPFKRFTKMRGNKVGTRFEASIVHVNSQGAVYHDEVMLKGWTDSNTGQTVSFWLANVSVLFHPFHGMREGDEFALVLVELAEDNEQVDQDKRERVEQALKPKGPKGPQRLSTAAAMMCNNPVFWDFLNDRGLVGYRVNGKADAAFAMRSLIEVDSRSELDIDADAAQRFHMMLRRPFVEWQRENRVGEFA